LGNLALIYKITNQLEKAQNTYGQLIQIKENMYGIESEALILPLK